MVFGYAYTILSAAKLLLIILTNLYLTDKKIKTVSQIKDGNELRPAHGGKRQFMVSGGRLMAQTDKSWRKTAHRRHVFGVTMSGRQAISDKFKTEERGVRNIIADTCFYLTLNPCSFCQSGPNFRSQ